MSYETNEALNRAILNQAEADGFTDEGDIVGDWVLVATLTNMEDSSKDGNVILASRGKATPDHIMRGLLHQAIFRLNQGFLSAQLDDEAGDS